MADDAALIAKAAEALHERFAPDYAGHWDNLDDFERRESDYPDMARTVLAAVRDQIAAEALREAASAIDSGEADHEELRQGGIDGVSPRGWSEASVIAAHDVGSVWADWLHARADQVDPRGDA